MLYKRVLFFLFVFVAAFSVWYSPAVFKGHTPYKISELIVIARNLHNTGEFRLENDKNVYLASSLIKEGGETATVGNKLTAYLYSYLFKITGVLSPDKLVLFSILLNALSLLIFSYIVFRLFGFAISGLFSLIYILIPFMWLSVYSLGVYEFAVFFFSLFTFSFVLGREKKHEWLWMVFAGVFLSLAALSREAFFLLVPILPVYFWFYGKRKMVFPLLTPIVLILSVFYLPSFLGVGGGNVYSDMFLIKNSREGKFLDSGNYSHLYPDPYIYHFEKENFLSDYNNKIDKAGILESLQMKKVLANLGERSTGIFERAELGAVLLFTHLAKFISFESIGGPFVFLFSVLGLFYLRGKDRGLYNFSVWWLLGTILLLSFIVIVNRDHLRDFNWLIPLLASLGIFYLVDRMGFDGRMKPFIFLLVVFSFLYCLLLSDHVAFGKLYDDERNKKLELYADEMIKNGINDKDIVALGLGSKNEAMLSYLSDKSMVALAPETIEKLIKQEKLQEVFDYFGVKYVLGYDEDLSKKIKEKTNATTISLNQTKTGDKMLSPLRLFILNLVN